MNWFCIFSGAVTALHVSEDYSVLTGSSDKCVCLWRPGFRWYSVTTAI